MYTNIDCKQEQLKNEQLRQAGKVQASGAGGNPLTDQTPKPYIFYCVMTISVLLLALAFAASELFSMFFSKGDIGGMFISKFFGVDGSSEMSFKEIILSQSFSNLSFWNDISDSNTVDVGNNTQIPNTPSYPNADPPETEITDTVPNDNSGAPSGGIYDYDPDSVPRGMGGIMPMDLSLSEYGIDYIHNQSSADPDIESLKKLNVTTDASSIYPADSPIVLIIHTHGTEGFVPENAKYYDPSGEIARSEDTSLNVVAVGKILSDELNKIGIPTLHCEIMNDLDGYSGSYTRSAEKIKEYLKRYPSIQYVIDVHRDSIVRSTGELIKPIVETRDGGAAQIMCVVGTGASASPCPRWENNLALAQKLREKLNATCENICRPTCLRDSSYNQQFSAYSLLLEMGAAGNSLSEVSLSAKITAEALANIIIG